MAIAKTRFQFTLTQDEFLDIFFEDLELPNLVKRVVERDQAPTAWKRAGITVAGSPTNMNLIRTMRNAHGRRLALKSSVDEGNERAERAPVSSSNEIAQPIEEEVADEIKEHYSQSLRRWRRVAAGRPLSTRWTCVSTPMSRRRWRRRAAVMFCLMDVSGSMGEREKDLAKRFYMLLYLFLKRRYERVEVVFIRHTHHAEEVDEETFFYSRQSGGTVVSTALDKDAGSSKRPLPGARMEHLCGAGV